MFINTNVPAMFAYRSLAKHQNGVATATERLSSGLRINRAADDAAGLAIAEKMRAQVNGLNQAQRNSGDGVSLMQSAEGGLNETHAILQRMRTLAVQASNSGVMTSDNLRAIQAEMTQLTAEIDKVAFTTQFNGMTLLDGTFRDKSLQVGANAGDVKTVNIVSAVVPAIPPIPERPAIPAEPARVALWEVDEGLADLTDPSDHTRTQGLSFTHTMAGVANAVSVTVPAPVTTVTDLVDKLNADTSFSAAFEASPGTHTHGDGTVEITNVIITAKAPGRGAVSVSGIPHDESKYQTDPGRPAYPAVPEVPGEPARYLGYAAADILGPVAIDVTREAGSSTTTQFFKGLPARLAGGTSVGFGTLTENPATILPATKDRYETTTTTWNSGAYDALGLIDRAIAIVSEGRAEMGATQNGLEHTIAALGVSSENLALSESRIRDADMAKEISTLQQRQITSQAAMSMLQQANQVPQMVLKLLQ